MKQPRVYMCSPSQSPHPPPSPPIPSRFSQCTRSEHLSHADPPFNHRNVSSHTLGLNPSGAQNLALPASQLSAGRSWWWSTPRQPRCWCFLCPRRWEVFLGLGLTPTPSLHTPEFSFDSHCPLQYLRGKLFPSLFMSCSPISFFLWWFWKSFPTLYCTISHCDFLSHF